MKIFNYTTNANKKSSIISDAKIQEIREFWMRNRNSPLRLADIRKGVWKSDDDSQKPCYSTLSNVLRRKLRISYRILRPRHHKTTTRYHVRLYWEGVMIQNILSNKFYELIFIVFFLFIFIKIWIILLIFFWSFSVLIEFWWYFE